MNSIILTDNDNNNIILLNDLTKVYENIVQDI